MLKLNNVKKVYSDNKANSVVALDDVTVEFPQKGMIFITGKSGCGKTTILNVIAGLDEYEQGDILLDDMPIDSLSGKMLDKYRNEYLGVIFQDYSLLEQYSVEENILLPIRIREYDKSFKIEDKLNEVLKCVDMEGYGIRMPNELSGGQKQRVAIARAIIKEPKILLADEPTGNLDEKNSDVIMKILKQLSKEMLVIVVSHDMEETLKYADRIIQMSDGKIISDRENKATCEYSYNFKSVTGNINMYDIEKEELTKKIDAIVNECTNEEKEYDLAISCTRKKEKINKNKSNIANLEYRIKKLGLARVNNLAFGNMKRKKMRFFITMIMLSIISTLTILLGFLLYYQKGKIISEFVDSRQYHATSVYQEKETYNEAENIQISSMLEKGYSLFESIQKSIDYNDISICKEEMIISKKDSENSSSFVSSEASLLYVDERNSYYKYTGEFPNSKNEILISDYIAYEKLKMSNPIGETVEIEEKEYVVSGVIETGYEDYEYLNRIKFYNYNEIVEYEEDFDFLIAILNKSFIDDIYGKSNIYLSKGNFLYDEDDNIQNPISINEYSQQKLLWGREPKNKNEVVISCSMAEELGYALWNESTESMEIFLNDSKTCSVADLYDDKYGYEYKEEINLYDYFGAEVNIVGILGPSDENIPADVYIEKTLYQDMKQDYLKYYYGDKYIIYYDDINNFVEQCEDGGITIDNPIVLNIVIFDSLLNGAEMLLYVVIILLMIVLFLVIISYVSYSITDSSRNIGIMRTLGITNGDILKIYSQEALMLCVFAIICTFLETNAMLRFLNEEYSEKILGYKTLFIEWNTNVMLIMIIIICVICICASAIPIRKLSREYPIKLMKKVQ